MNRQIITIWFLASALAAGNVHESVRPFTQGTRLLSASTGLSIDPEKGRTYLFQFHRNDFVADDVSMYYGLNLAFAHPRRRPSGIQGGPEVGARWHFAEKQNGSLFLEGSIGTVFHQYAWTEDSLRFNFDLQAGIGATRRIGRDLLLKTGFGWHHLSNARVQGKGKNLGYDGLLFTVGLMRPF